MADLTSDAIASNFQKFSISQSDAGRELVLQLAGTNLTHANLQAVYSYITTAHGVDGSGDSAFTVAAIGTADGTAFVSGTTDTVFMRVQGTGTFDTTDAAAGIGGCTVTVEAVFSPAL
jgi:hypothetical protein